MLSSEQFYLRGNTLVFNKDTNINLLDNFNKDILKMTDIVKFDLRLVGELFNDFLKKIISFIVDTNINGVIMYLSKELSYFIEDYQNQIKLANYSKTNSFIIFDSPKNIDIFFFNGIESTPIDKIKENIVNHKKKEIVLNFNNLSPESLNNFIPSFMGWMMNSGLKNISFSKHYGEINEILEKKGIYCMFNVSSSISFPKRKRQLCRNTNNKKINKFLKFANYAALQF